MEYDINSRLINIALTTQIMERPILYAFGLSSLFRNINVFLGKRSTYDSQEQVTQLCRLLASQCIRNEQIKKRKSLRKSSRERHQGNIDAMQKIINKSRPSMRDLEATFSFYKQSRSGKKGLVFQSIDDELSIDNESSDRSVPKELIERRRAIQHHQSILDNLYYNPILGFFSKLMDKLDAYNQKTPSLPDNAVDDFKINLDKMRAYIQKGMDAINQTLDQNVHSIDEPMSQSMQSLLGLYSNISKMRGQLHYLGDQPSNHNSAIQSQDYRLYTILDDRQKHGSLFTLVPQNDPEIQPTDSEKPENDSESVGAKSRIFFGGIQMDANGDPQADISVMSCSSGVSSICVPSFSSTNNTMVAHVSNLYSDGVKTYPWFGLALQTLSDEQFKNLLEEKANGNDPVKRGMNLDQPDANSQLDRGLNGLFNEIINGQVNKNNQLNGDCKEDNILWDPRDGKITIIDNDYKQDETPSDLYTGLIINKLFSSGWKEFTGSGYELTYQFPDDATKLNKSILDVWISEQTSQLNGHTDYQSLSSSEMIARLREMTTAKQAALGEGLLLQFLKLGPEQTVHDVFALCTLATRLVDRAYYPADCANHPLKKWAIAYQKQIFDKLSEIVQDQNDLSVADKSHLQSLTQLQKAAILQSMAKLQGLVTRQQYDPETSSSTIAGYPYNPDDFLEEINQELPDSQKLTLDAVQAYGRYLDETLPKLDQLNTEFTVDHLKKDLRGSLNPHYRKSWLHSLSDSLRLKSGYATDGSGRTTVESLGSERSNSPDTISSDDSDDSDDDGFGTPPRA